MSTTEPIDKKTFEDLILSNFAFIESEAKMTFGGVRRSGGRDPRDSTLVARYSNADMRFDIGWNEFELSLAVLIKFEKVDLLSAEKYSYFEPLVVYLTDGTIKAIVPYITENMSVENMEQVMEQRRKIFNDGLRPILEKLSHKFRNNLDAIQGVTAEQLSGYHHWMKTMG